MDWKGPNRVEWFIEDDPGTWDAYLVWKDGEIFLREADDLEMKRWFQITPCQIDRLIACLNGLKDALASGGIG